MKSDELADLVEAIKKNNVDLGATKAGRKLREILRVQKWRWGSAAPWEVP